MSAFIFLSRVEARGGALCYVPGGPNDLKGFALENSPEALWVRAFTLNDRLVEHLAEPGDALLFSHLMAHSPSTNLSESTREAVDIRFVARDRIVPGDKPVDEMTILERLNSPAALRDMGRRFASPALPDDDRVVRIGLGGYNDVLAHDILRKDGRVHILYVDGSDPTSVRSARTRDLTTWVEHESFRVAEEPIHGLHVDSRFATTLTVVTEGGSTVWRSDDLRAWEPVSEQPDVVQARPHFVHENQGSAQARETATFYVESGSPNVVRWRSGSDSKDDRQPAEGVALSLDEGVRIVDVLVRPVFDTARFALVMDVEGPDGTRVWYSASKVADRYEEPARPLAFDAPTPPRRIRVYDRAREFWLVTYVRDTDEGPRIHWGTIDWQMGAEVREIRTAAGLRSAFQVIGLA